LKWMDHMLSTWGNDIPSISIFFYHRRWSKKTGIEFSDLLNSFFNLFSYENIPKSYNNFNNLIFNLKTPFNHFKNWTSNQIKKTFRPWYIFYGMVRGQNHLNWTSLSKTNHLTLRFIFFLAWMWSANSFSFISFFSHFIFPLSIFCD
jgi:hypothetical protein